MNRRRKVINPNVPSSTKTDAEVSRRLTSDPVSQAKKFIDKILISISRIAPNDWLSKKLSDQRRRKKILTQVHSELRVLWENCDRIF